MPNVNLENSKKLDLIHARRMLHAFAQVLGRLLLIEDYRVQLLLNEYSVVLMPGPRVGIEYPTGGKQILEVELKQEKESIEGKRKAANKLLSKKKKR